MLAAFSLAMFPSRAGKASLAERSGGVKFAGSEEAGKGRTAEHAERGSVGAGSGL